MKKSVTDDYYYLAAEEKSEIEQKDEGEADLDTAAVIDNEMNENLADPTKLKNRRHKEKFNGKKNKEKAKKNNKKQRNGKNLNMNIKRKKTKKNQNKGKKKINVKKNKGMKKTGRRQGSKQKILRQTDCNSCAVNLWKYRDVMVKLNNYEKQFRRIKKFKSLGGIRRLYLLFVYCLL